jgi:hypothetical protein
MKIDDLCRKVTESAKDIKYLRGDVAELKRDMKEETKTCHDQITQMKEIQNLNAGKLSVVLITIGAGILGSVQLLIWILGKIKW